MNGAVRYIEVGMDSGAGFRKIFSVASHNRLAASPENDGFYYALPSGLQKLMPFPMRQIWIDYLRVFSIIAVIMTHVSSPYYGQFGKIPLGDWWFVNIMDAVSRFAVAVFVMISGSLMLGRERGVKDIYINRALRIIPSILFWPILFVLAKGSALPMEAHQVLSMLVFAILVPSSISVHLWYLPMYACLMMFAPFANGYIVGNKPTAKEFTLLLYVILVFFTILQTSNVIAELFKVHAWWFTLVPNFLCYFVLGYGISAYYEQLHISNVLVVLLVVVIIAVGAGLNYYMISAQGIVKDYFVFDNLGAFVFPVSVSIFYLFSKNRHLFKESKVISCLASTSFGVYLIHPIFISLFNGKLAGNIGNMPIRLLSGIAFVLLFSHLTIAAFRKTKWLRMVC